MKGKVILDVEELKKYLLEKRKNSPHDTVPGEAVAKPATGKDFAVQLKPMLPLNHVSTLSKENSEAFQKFRQQLVLKSYSASTIKTYSNEFMQFLQTIRNVPADTFTTSRIKDYLQHCFEKLKLSENTLHSRMNALKFYYETTQKRKIFLGNT